MIIVPDGVPMVVSMSNDTISLYRRDSNSWSNATGGTAPYTYNWVGLVVMVLTM
jgi:hypothetical protein